MKKQLLKLIKGLNKFKTDDLCQMAELEESEIQPYLSEFTDEGIIIKISADSYTMLEKIPQRQTKRRKNAKAEKIEKQKKLLQFSQEELDKFKKIPENLRKPAEKYLKILYMTQDMTPKKIRSFLENQNKNNSELKMGYSTYSRVKQRLSEEGIIGLIPKYSAYNKGQSIIKKQIYEKFKSLYLQPHAPSRLSCYNEVKTEFAHYYEEWNFPGYLTFKRKLETEFTEDEIKIYRTSLNDIPIESVLSAF